MMKSIRSIEGQWFLISSNSGAVATASSFSICSRTGESETLRRIQRTTIVSTAAARNGILQPHSCTASSGSRPFSSEAITEAPRKPADVAIGTVETQRARLCAGACSASSTAAPEYSPAAQKLCSIRAASSRIGAASPIVA